MKNLKVKTERIFWFFSALKSGCWGRVLAVTFSILVSACVSEIPKSSPVDNYDAFVNQDNAEELVVPEAVTDALLAQNSANAVLTPVVNRFDVSVNSIPAKTFFVSLVSDAGVNVVAHPEIEGVISLNLRNVTIEEVLEVVKDVYGYEYRFQSGIYTIYPRKLRTQIFQVDYLDVKRVGVTDTSVVIGDINASSGSGSGRNGNNSSGGGQGQNSANLLGEADDGEEKSGSSAGQGFSPGARIQTLSATNFWGFLRTSLASMIGNEEGRFVMTNPHAGVVVVRAMPSELQMIREFLEKSELSIQRQVILETKILEVQLNEEHASGINWAAIGGQLAGSYTDQDIETTTFSSLLGTTETIAERTKDTLFSSVLGVTDVTKLIGLLDRQGDVTVLSSPRISTVNNQKAVIRVGSDEFFVTGISNSTTASASTVTNTPQVELSSFFSGISLDVTPQIDEQGDVILHVHPIVSDVQDQLKEIQVGEDNFALPLALRDVRESDSIVKASSGQVVVLGGLMQESSAEVDTKRSRLGGVPVLNIFFKHESKQLKKTELVILMRPIVIDDDEWDTQVQQSRVRLDQFSENR